MTPEQRERLMAVINRQPTNPPAPRLSISEIDELRALVDCGRGEDAWAELAAKANSAYAKSSEELRRKSQEQANANRQHRMAEREHIARMQVLNAQGQTVHVDKTLAESKPDPERDERIFKRRNALRAAGVKAFLKKLAAEENLSETRIKQIISRHEDSNGISRTHPSEPHSSMSFSAQLKRANK